MIAFIIFSFRPKKPYVALNGLLFIKQTFPKRFIKATTCDIIIIIICLTLVLQTILLYLL